MVERVSLHADVAACMQWYTSDTTLYSQPLAKTESEFLDSDSDYDEFDPQPLANIPTQKFISDESAHYVQTRSVRAPLPESVLQGPFPLHHRRVWSCLMPTGPSRCGR